MLFLHLSSKSHATTRPMAAPCLATTRAMAACTLCGTLLVRFFCTGHLATTEPTVGLWLHALYATRSLCGSRQVENDTIITRSKTPLKAGLKFETHDEARTSQTANAWDYAKSLDPQSCIRLECLRNPHANYSPLNDSIITLITQIFSTGMEKTKYKQLTANS
jgi:hypothetical protein